MRRMSLLLASLAVLGSGAAFAQMPPTQSPQAQTAPAAPAPDGNSAGQRPTSPAAPGQGNGSDPGGSGPGGTGPGAGVPFGNGRGVDSEFSAFKPDAAGRAPLTAPPGELDPGRRAPSQPPQVMPQSPWHTPATPRG